MVAIDSQIVALAFLPNEFSCIISSLFAEGQMLGHSKIGGRVSINYRWCYKLNKIYMKEN